MNELPDTAFWQAYLAKSYGILQWADMEALWARLAARPADWFIFDYDAPPPTTIADGNRLKTFLAEASAFIHQQQKANYCGCIYVDDAQNPTFIRIFDPKNMGTACGCSGNRIYPKWSLTRLKPEVMPVAKANETKSGWLGKVLKRA